MVDAFPASTADREHAVHTLIDADLRNARRLLLAFERDFPPAAASELRTVVARMRNRPAPEALYPNLFQEGSADWLAPLARRLRWNLARGDSAGPWPDLVQSMLGLVLRNVRQVSEVEFLALAEPAQSLVEHRCVGYLERMAALARRLEQDGPLSADAAAAVARLFRVCDHPRGTTADRRIFAWPLFRSENGLESFAPCWSERVRRELAGLEPTLRAAWLRIFDAEPHAVRGGASMLSRGCLAAVKRLGPEQFEQGLRRWVGLLGETPGPTLSPAGVIVLQHVIVLCDLLGGRAGDELLYAIACAPWADPPANAWIATYLWAIGRRTEDRAFACLEALMMRPATAVPAVRERYDGLLAVFGAAALPASPVGVDGYPLDREPALRPQQTRIDQFLALALRAAAQGPYVYSSDAVHRQMLREVPEQERTPAMKAWAARLDRPLPWFPVAPEVTAAFETMQATILREFSQDPAALHRAVAARAAWIAAHKPEYAPDAFRLWNQLFRGLGCQGGLLQRSLAPVDALTLDALLEAIRTGAGNPKVFTLAQQYVAGNGWSLDLVEALRKWVPTLGVAASTQTLRAQVEWFLWFEDVAPVALDACWSHRIKRDLRAMPVELRAGWRALLDNPTFIITGTPPKKWLKAAESMFAKIDAVDFRKRFVAWFEPFGAGEPLRLTVAGRNVLRVLMWYALLAGDAAVDQALLGFGRARWKTKDTEKRAAQAEMAFSYVLSQRTPETVLPILEGMVASGQAFPGSTTYRIYEGLRARGKRTTPTG